MHNGWALVTRMRLEVLALLAAGILVLGSGITQAPLIDWDEATYAEVAHEAVASGSYLDLTWNGEAYLKKPPIQFWMMIASFKAFGESEWAARLPSVVMGILTLLMIYLAAEPVAGRLGGFFAGLIPLGFYFFVARGGRECATDAPMIFFITTAMYALERARARRGWLAVVGLASGLAILSKGVVGFMPLIVATLAVAIIPTFSAIGLGGLILAFAMAGAVASPWFIYEALSKGDLFWTTFIKHETLSRIATHLEDHPHALSYTLHTFRYDVRHLWPLLLPLGGMSLAAAVRWKLSALRQLPPAVGVWVLWLGVALGAAMIVQTKLGWYVLPALIPVALIGGAILGGALMQTGKARLYCVPLAAAALALLVITEPHNRRRIEVTFQEQRARSMPSYAMAMRARDLAALHPNAQLFFAGITLPTLVYYSGMPCHFVTPAAGRVELIDLGGRPVNVEHDQLMMRTQSGDLLPVGDYDDLWKQLDPYAKPSSNHQAPAGSESGG